MGLQSFKFPVDFLNNLEKPIIYIAKKDKEIVNSVSVYDGLKLTFNLNAFQTCEFKIYRDVDGKRQEYFNAFEEEMLVMIPGVSWYEIHVETNIEQTGISKTITATSLEVKLCDKRLIDFECNAGEILYDDYVKTIFYDPTNPEGSLLNRVLNVSPNWTVGHVDDSLANKQRTFDVDDTDVYSFLTGEVSEAFNCLFVFDTFNCTVNAYDLDTYGKDTDIFVSMDNLAQNMTETIDQNSIFTCYRVNGGDGVYINEVNPNGTNKIYNFEYYLSQMSQELQSKVTAYNNKYQVLKPQYEDIMLQMQAQVDIIQELNTRLPDSLSSKDWTLYGLAFLESKQKSFKTQDELYCAQGMNNPQSLSYNLYKQNLQDLNDVTAEISVRRSEIDSAMQLYMSIKAERDELQEQLDMDNWFTVDDWKSLDNYVIEASYDNDNYIVTDLEDDSQRLDIERQLYNVAWEDLSKKCRPQYQYSATLANILTIPEFKNFLEYFELGNFIRMETDYDTIVKLRMISFTVDYSNTKTIDVTFSDAIRVKDIYEDASSIQAQANSAAMSFQFNKDQYDKTVKEGNWVAHMRKYGLDVSTTAIHNSSNQVQTWDSTGMTFRQWNEERQDYDPEMAKIINNMMVFSDDSMQTVRMGIGKIFLPNGESAYGINGEVILGKLFLGEYLTLENDSGTYKFDDSGFSASNGINTVKIQPNNSGELFSIYKGSSKQFYINSDGDAEFSGVLQAASGQFAGLISGGEININNTFTVDKNGNVYASSCNISGDISGSTITGTDISASTINGTNITGSTITGTSITGNTISGGTISGSTIQGGSIKIGNGFSVDSGGNLKSISGEFSSAIFKNTIFYGLDYNGQMTYFPIINVPSQGNITFGLRTAHTTFPGSVQFDSYILINQDIFFGAGATTYGTSSGTENSKLYKANNGGNENIPSAGWVKNYVSHNVPNTNNFASKYHNHNIKSLLYSETSSGNIVFDGCNLATTNWVLNNFKRDTSDRRLKTEICDIDDIYSLYMSLKPKSYKFNPHLSYYDDKVHYGFIAQDIQHSLAELNKTNFALVQKRKCETETNEDKIINGDYFYIVNKDELHALHVIMIQKQQHEIESLKKQIHELNEKTNNENTE